MTTVKGIDVASYQGQVDWHKIYAQGYRFAIAKATQGNQYHNPFFTPANWQAMRAARLIRGAYHYAEPGHGSSGREEAEFFLAAVAAVGGRVSGDLPLCLDIETAGDQLRPAQIRRWCSDFCKVVFRETGREAITYTGAFWRDRVGTLGPPRHGSMLWLSRFGVNDGRTVSDPIPSIPAGGFKLLIHQWTDNGRIEGVASRYADLNLWRGTLAELRALCRDDGTPSRPTRRSPADGGAVAPVPSPARDAPHKPMSTKQVQLALRKIGWPIAVSGTLDAPTTEAIRDFQRGYAFTTLRVSGRPGPKTNRALRECAANGGRCSEHFRFSEFASRGNRWIKVDRDLVRGLERYRQAIGRSVTIVDGYRDPAHNRHTEGAATDSQHLYGNAADIPCVLSLERVKALGVFSGIGHQGRAQLVRHVDVRHRGPNTTGSTIANPATWAY